MSDQEDNVNDDDLDYYDMDGVLQDTIEEEDEEKKANGEYKEDEDDEELFDEIPSSKESTKPTIYVPQNERKTGNKMTKYEVSRLIASLAKLYSNGLPVHPDLQTYITGMIDPIDIAEVHVKHRKTVLSPININRPILGRSNMLELWYPDEMYTPEEVIAMGSDLKLLKQIT